MAERASDKARRARRKTAGKCADCEDRASPGRTRCERHLALKAASADACKRRQRGVPDPVPTFEDFERLMDG